MSTYVRPSSIDEAITCLERERGEARVIAGGTDVMPDLRKGNIAPCCLVDITGIAELQRIEVDSRWVTVGAAVTFASLRQHAFLREHVHALVDAAGSVGASAIQNAATWVGNIVQAMPAADGAIVALALQAEVRVVTSNGATWRAVDTLFAGPGLSRIDSCREIITHVRFARPQPGMGSAWQRIGRRRALVLPILNCAVCIHLDASPGAKTGARDRGRKIGDVAIALGPVAPRPFRAQRAEVALRGNTATSEIMEQAAAIARDEAQPRTSMMRASREYRLDILPTLVSQALETAVMRASDSA